MTTAEPTEPTPQLMTDAEEAEARTIANRVVNQSCKLATKAIGFILRETTGMENGPLISLTVAGVVNRHLPTFVRKGACVDDKQRGDEQLRNMQFVAGFLSQQIDLAMGEMVDKVMAATDAMTGESSALFPPGGVAEAVLQSLGDGERHTADDLLERTKLDPALLAAALGALEMVKLIEVGDPEGGERWARLSPEGRECLDALAKKQTEGKEAPGGG